MNSPRLDGLARAHIEYIQFPVPLACSQNDVASAVITVQDDFTHRRSMRLNLFQRITSVDVPESKSSYSVPGYSE